MQSHIPHCTRTLYKVHIPPTATGRWVGTQRTGELCHKSLWTPLSSHTASVLSVKEACAQKVKTKGHIAVSHLTHIQQSAGQMQKGDVSSNTNVNIIICSG